MITLKQFRRKPINNDPRGIPVLIQQGMHSIKYLPPEELAAKGLPNILQQNSQLNERWSTPNDTYGQPADWMPGYKYNVEPYYAKLGAGHPYQNAMKRRIDKLPNTGDFYNDIKEALKHDNLHISDEQPDASPLSHLSSVHKKLSEHYQGDLHPELRRYSSDSSDLNRYLYTSHDMGKKIEDQFQDYNIADLDKVLGKNKLPEPLTVYTGIKFNPGLVAAKNMYNRIIMPGYMSTSIDPTMASAFSRNLARGTERDRPSFNGGSSDTHMLRIHLPKDFGGEYLGSRSSYDSESEFLTPRGTTLQIMPNPRIIRTKNPNNGILSTVHNHIWDAHPVKP